MGVSFTRDSLRIVKSMRKELVRRKMWQKFVNSRARGVNVRSCGKGHGPNLEIKPVQPAAATNNFSTLESRSWATFRASGLPYGARKLAIRS